MKQKSVRVADAGKRSFRAHHITQSISQHRSHMSDASLFRNRSALSQLLSNLYSLSLPPSCCRSLTHPFHHHVLQLTHALLSLLKDVVRPLQVRRMNGFSLVVIDDTEDRQLSAMTGEHE